MGGIMDEELRSSRTPLVIFIISVAVVVVVVIGFFLVKGWLDGKRQETAPPPAPTIPTPAPTPTPTLQERLSARLQGVTLATSDLVVRSLVGELSSQPKLSEWLVNEDLIRRFVATVANVADGQSPKSHLEFLAPEGAFTVKESGGEIRVDPSCYARYDLVVTVIDSLDPEGSGTLFRELEPLFDEAYAEIAPRGRQFETTLFKAIDHLLAVPVIDSRPELKPLVVTFEFADTKLEELTAAQRHLLRFGPDNVKTLQQKLSQLKATLAEEPVEELTNEE
jgi:hypothetical protein